MAITNKRDLKEPSSAGEDSAAVTGEETGERDPHLIRGVGLASATTLNMIDMIGVGPFITIPLIVAAMGGPQAMLGWIFGAVLVMCDGLVWAELGAAMPGSGGSYRYLKEIYGPNRLGRLISFLFIWQLTFSAPLSIASGCIGLSQYAGYLWPSLGRTFVSKDFHLLLPLVGQFDASFLVTGGTFVAMATIAVAVFLLYRKITIISRMSKFLWVGVLLTVLWVIFSGVTHFDSARAFDFPPAAFTPSLAFFQGLGAAMLVSVYDYWGYYNVCFFGGEVKDPGRTIPRAIIYSIIAVASIYIVMNISILGVIHWQELVETAKPENEGVRSYIISTFMETLYGRWAGGLASVLIMWTAFASVFSLMLGYSRVPYAAALDGNYFKVFSRVHSKHRFPYVSLLVMGTVAAACCLLRLRDVITALVVIRITVQFLAQIIGVIVLRVRRPDMPRPFRMWLYPLPSLLAFIGFVYVLVMRPKSLQPIWFALALIFIGTAIYMVRSSRRGEWPFGRRATAAPTGGD
ncbi:MAG TPA: APC family permease [Blastocatellia bacterium]|jgi:amino acid transporter|nr:APC family permease [Blastocatellia bacterium]